MPFRPGQLSPEGRFAPASISFRCRHTNSTARKVLDSLRSARYQIEFLQEGGGQEQGRRAGTENVPGIVGFGLALERAELWRDTYAEHCSQLRNRLMEGVLASIPDARVNGPVALELRLPNNLNVSFPGVEGETLLLSLDMLGIVASAGSACTTGNTDPVTY